MDFKPTSQPCRVCGNTDGNRSFTAREQDYGIGDEFDYFECGACGCLQIAEAPADMGRYYPDAYYSFASNTLNGKATGPRAFLKRRLIGHLLGHADPLGALLARFSAGPYYCAWMKGCGLGFDSSVLDVGCGSGELLRRLAADGFTNLTGIDAFIKEEPPPEKSLRIRKLDLLALEGRFDFIMLHHAFEHMPDPRGALAHLRTLMDARSRLLIRVPVAGTYAWRHYGTDWVQFDAPRHLFLHSVKSLRLLAEACGLAVERVDFDSLDFQFWGSEQNRKGMALWSEPSHAVHPEKSMFTPAQIAEFKRRTEALNAAQDGDSACFLLKPA